MPSWSILPMDACDEAAVRCGDAENQKRALLRKYGYGVANYDRAILSANNDLTLIAEDDVQPVWKDDGSIKTRHMNLHQFPWPRTKLEELGELQVELRITLSYYIEPNPGERGRLRRHRYASHALRFAVKRELESVDEFRGRINAAAEAEEAGLAPIAGGTDRWYLGRIRNVGSIHSDHWYGNAADLAKKSAIGVYPIGGWSDRTQPTHVMIAAFATVWLCRFARPMPILISTHPSTPRSQSPLA